MKQVQQVVASVDLLLLLQLIAAFCLVDEGKCEVGNFLCLFP